MCMPKETMVGCQIGSLSDRAGLRIEECTFVQMESSMENIPGSLRVCINRRRGLQIEIISKHVQFLTKSY